MTEFTCPACGKTDEVLDGSDPAQAILKCGDCGVTIAFGKVRDRIVIEPHSDPRMRVVRVTPLNGPTVTHVWDKDLAFAVGQNLLSISR